MSELRGNPLLEEWVIPATHRQDRTHLPPRDYCPLCPTRPGAEPTEVPAADYEIAVLENRFPSLRPNPAPPTVEGDELYPVAPGQGVCEVVLYTPQHEGSLADQPVEQIEKLITVWTDRYEELGARPEIDYVFIFENKGEAIGVTIAHPHGQIYAFPYVPPRIAREIESCEKHYGRHGRCLVCDILAAEISDGRRVVAENASFVAVVPFFARWPYEVHVYSRRHCGSLSDLDAPARRDLAALLKRLLLKYDHLFGFSLPYMMVLHQRPTDGGQHESYHFHVEFYPPYRTATKLKYLAGCESGAGSFINDTLAEEKAAELRAVYPGDEEPLACSE